MLSCVRLSLMPLAVLNCVPPVQWTDMEIKSGYSGLKLEGYYIEFRNMRMKKI